MYEYKVILIAEVTELKKRKPNIELVTGDLPDDMLQQCLDEWCQFGYRLHTLHVYDERRMLVVLERKRGSTDSQRVATTQAGASA